MQPPIVPGTPEPYTLAAVMPATAPKRRPWNMAVIVGGVVLALAGGGFVAWQLAHPPAAPAAAVSPSPTSTPIRDAYFGCGQVGAVSDRDRTIVLDTQGTGLSQASISDVNCILQHLGAPGSIIETMKRTRAIDGRQRGQWGTFDASWTYHPDQGLDVIIQDSA